VAEVDDIALANRNRCIENQPCVQTEVSLFVFPLNVCYVLTTLNSAYYRFSERRLTMEVVAFRAIRPGEEILMSCKLLWGCSG
jgi:hypothetical protein